MPRRARPPPPTIGALGIVTDVRETDQVDAALARTTAELGPASILVNNAGGTFWSSILDTSENGWDALYRSNLRHVLLCTQRIARGMVDAGIGGSIINVTSIEGVRAAPGYAAYAAAKAGVINFTKTAALEFAPHGIRVNALAPDITITEGIQALAQPVTRTDSARRCRWGGPATSTRWQPPRCSWPSDGRLHHRPDPARRRRDPRRQRLVPPPRHRRLLPRTDRLSETDVLNQTVDPRAAMCHAGKCNRLHEFEGMRC